MDEQKRAEVLKDCPTPAEIREVMLNEDRPTLLDVISLHMMIAAALGETKASINLLSRPIDKTFSAADLSDSIAVLEAKGFKVSHNYGWTRSSLEVSWEEEGA